jgi:hypothetical protein
MILKSLAKNILIAGGVLSTTANTRPANHAGDAQPGAGLPGLGMIVRRRT